MAQLLLLARLFASAVGVDQQAITCWYEPPTGANACFVDIADTGNTVGGIEFRRNADGSGSVIVETWEY